MWDAEIETMEDGRLCRAAVLRDGKPLSYAEAIERWQDDDAFRAFLTALLADAPFAAVLWETPPITAQSAGRGGPVAMAVPCGRSVEGVFETTIASTLSTYRSRVLATRKPGLTYWTPMPFLLRLAARRSLGSRLQEPPRRTHKSQTPSRCQTLPSVGAPR